MKMRVKLPRARTLTSSARNECLTATCTRLYRISLAIDDTPLQILDPTSRQGERRLSVRLNMRLGDGAFGPLHRIRILELNGDPSLAIGKTYLLHHEAQIRFGFRYRESPAFFTLLGRPSEKPEGLGAVAGSDGIFHIRIRPRLVQLVIK